MLPNISAPAVGACIALASGVFAYTPGAGDAPGPGGQTVGAPSAVPVAIPPSTQDQLVLVPLPPAVYAGLATLGAVAGVHYLRRRRVQNA